MKTEVKDCMLTDINHWGYHELQQHQVGKEGESTGLEKEREQEREERFTHHGTLPQDAVIKKCEVLVDDLQKRMAATK